MRRASQIQTDISDITTIAGLTGVFESLSITRVSRIKDRVQLSKEFFQLLWRIYISLRDDPHSRITHRTKHDTNGRNGFVIISAEAGLSGDIDQRLIEAMLADYHPSNTDIFVLGTHGANELTQRGIPFIRYYKIPETEAYLNVSPIIRILKPYESIKIYYEEYVSLGEQDINTIDLYSNIQEMSKTVSEDDRFITTEGTIFEPSLDQIAELMENTMLNLAFSQVILESTLAQDASRFNAMALAKKRAQDMVHSYNLEYHHAKRSESDHRLREVLLSLKKKKRAKKRKRV